VSSTRASAISRRQRSSVLPGEHRLDAQVVEAIGREPVAVAAQDVDLLVPVRVVDDQLEEEPVELGLGEGVRALGLDRVLGGENEEGRLQRIAGPVDRHLPLLHALEQGRLRLRRRPVDLVGQEHVRERRAPLEVELPGGEVEHAGADHVRRHEVRRELDPLVGAADQPRQDAGHQRLRGARDALQQDVTSREEGDERQAQVHRLAHEGALRLRDAPLECPGGLLAHRVLLLVWIR
jgi:hypothetical protein